MPSAPKYVTREGQILPGAVRSIPVPQPPAGQDWAVQVPGGKQWRVLSGSALFATSAAVANRVPRILLQDDNGIYFRGGETQSLVAGFTFWQSFGIDVPNSNSGSAATPSIHTLPDIWMQPGDELVMSTLAIDAADQWSAIYLRVEELWFDNPSLTDWVDVAISEALKRGGAH